MQYRFVREKADYSDLASGAVLGSAPGRPAFPVRLASELFQRAYSLWLDGAEPRRCALYDPCCGAGYLLTVVTLLHGNAIHSGTGSDVDPDVLQLAARNLALLTPAGLRARMDELRQQAHRFGKESHREAARSAERLLARVETRSAAEPTSAHLFQADVLDPGQVAAGLGDAGVDIVLTDTPYGATTTWSTPGPHDSGSMISRMLASLRPALQPGSIVVAVLPRGVRGEATGYDRVQRFRSGRREALFWRVG